MGAKLLTTKTLVVLDAKQLALMLMGYQTINMIIRVKNVFIGGRSKTPSRVLHRTRHIEYWQIHRDRYNSN